MSSYGQYFPRSGCSKPKTDETTLTKFDSGNVRRGLFCFPSPRLFGVATTLIGIVPVPKGAGSFSRFLNRRCVMPDLRIKNGSRRVRRLAGVGGDRHGKNKSLPVLLFLPSGEEGGVLPPSVFSDGSLFMILSSDLLHSASTSDSGHGFNWTQLKLLGVSWPPHKGWLSALVGQEVNDRTWELVMRLRYARTKPERQLILRRYGLDIRTLSQRPDRGPIKLITPPLS